jgi:hypothetical protein
MKHMSALVVCAALAAGLMLAASPEAFAANNSVQIAFVTNAAPGDAFNYVTPPVCADPSCLPGSNLIGFWFWCIGSASSHSKGVQADCSGTIYFYGISGVPFAVDGAASGSGKIYTMVVHSKDNSVMCSLTNLTATAGPSNAILVACTSPAGSATTSGSIVTITGP